jgi:predicted nucleic-acid-binding Zn-ribbon protein
VATDEPKCPKCGSAKQIRGVRAIDHEPGIFKSALRLSVYEEPFGLLKIPVEFYTHTRVCGSCGYIEWYVDDPQQLWETCVRLKEEERKRRQKDA